LAQPSNLGGAGVRVAADYRVERASSEPAPRVVAKTEPRSGDEIRALVEQRRMLAQLIDPLSEPTRKRKPGATGPRSDRATETSAA